jgi:hypothetical protein
MKQRITRQVIGLVGAAVLAGCGAAYEGEAGADLEAELELASAEAAVAACEGDDLQYDFNAFAASLAVAIANQLGRWDVNADFEVRNGKLELSSTGLLHCNGGCDNITALLRLQDDVTSNIPNHSPSVYRTKLTTWYADQRTKLTSLVDTMLVVDKGVFRVKWRGTSKPMAVRGGSTADGALIEQRGAGIQSGADQWRLILDHGKHRFVNVRSGKCLAMSANSSANDLSMVQRTCNVTDPLQRFEFAGVDGGYYLIRSKDLKALRVKDTNQADGTPVVQHLFEITNSADHWFFEPVSGGAVATAPEVVATAMYSITARHSGKALAVDNGSGADGALVEQASYAGTDDRFHWYITKNGSKYQIVNRRSGKCMDMLTDTPLSRIVQRPCSTAATQQFSFIPTGEGTHIVKTKQGKVFQIEGQSTNNDAPLAQETNERRLAQQFTITPLLAGEPHRLKFSHSTTGAPCGSYFWYNIAQPIGQALRAPADSYVQLIFAGGKPTLTGKDVNPFISQQVNGNQVAIDPSGYMNTGATSNSGSCIASDLLYDAGRRSAGLCCIKFNGATSVFAASSWSPSTFICR